MAHHRDGATIHHVRTLFSIGTMGGLSDAQLLERFASGPDEPAEQAFAALVERHGPMVLRVCQSVLGERHDAEDAFQATFLILVRNAASIRNRASIVSWLHGVAFRAASCQRRASARRHKHERTVAERAVLSIEDEPGDDTRLMIHQELDRLPEKYRAPIILCYFENLSHEAAAHQLDWPVGTVRSRLARGREQLRGRLVRRGLAPSWVLLERALGAETARAAISSALATATARAAHHYASAGFVAASVSSTSVVLLLEGALNVMFVAKLKSAVLACGLMAAGALVIAQQVGESAAFRTIRSAPVGESAPFRTIRSAPVGDTGNREARSTTLDEEDEAAVSRELGRLDVDLLAEEVSQLRTELELAIRNKIRAEKKGSGHTTEARKAFEFVRAEYLNRARELRTAQRRFGNGPAQGEPGPDESPRASKPSDTRVNRDLPTTNPGSPSAPAAIGSIDMDAIFQRYKKVKVSSKEYNGALLARKNELMRIMTEAQDEAQMLPKLAPGSADYKSHERHITELKARHEAEREQAEHDFEEREARMTADVLGEIQAVVADLAKAKGLDYVVKVSPGPRQDSAPSDVVMTAVNQSVVYADPKNDLTEEVIRDLNRKFDGLALEKSR